MLTSLTSCFEDEGNYDYDEIFDITVTGINSSYESFSLVDSLKISPVIEPQAEQYEYFWGVYKDAPGYKIDTICHTRTLNMFVELQPDTYKLLFGAKEKKSGIQKLITTELKVSTALSKGWYVLRSQNGSTDLDLFTPKGKITNVIAMNNEGVNLPGKAAFLNHSMSYFGFDSSRDRYVPTNTVFALSDGGMVAMRLHNGKIMRDFNTIFYSAPKTARPQVILTKWSDLFLLNANKAYSIYGMVPGSGRFGEAKTGDNYSLSDYVAGHQFTDPIFFDENSSSFCTADSYGGNLIYFKDSQTDCSSNNMGIDLLFMQSGANKDWAIARTKEKGKLQLLELNPKAAQRPYKDLITACTELKTSSLLGKADNWATNQSNNIIYHANGNKIYSCNIDADLSEQLEYTLSADEKVTYMRNLSFKNSKEPSSNFNVLAVATVKGNQYKVYLFDIQAGSLVGEPEILVGEGEVGAIIYIDNTNSSKIY